MRINGGRNTKLILAIEYTPASHELSEGRRREQKEKREKEIYIEKEFDKFHAYPSY